MLVGGFDTLTLVCDVLLAWTEAQVRKLLIFKNVCLKCLFLPGLLLSAELPIHNWKSRFLFCCFVLEIGHFCRQCQVSSQTYLEVTRDKTNCVLSSEVSSHN